MPLLIRTPYICSLTETISRKFPEFKKFPSSILDTKLKQVNLAAMLFHNVLTKIKKKKEKLKTFSDDSFQNMFVNQPCSGRNYDVQIMNLFHNFIFLTQECLG